MTVRQAAVSGTFYPADRLELGTQVRGLLDESPRDRASTLPRALIVPHAGFIYSGPVAASAYRLLRDSAQQYQRVMLLGPNHRVPLRTLAVPSASGFSCPLGEMALDSARLKEWVDRGWVEYNDEAHRLEHCIEVQLPFLLSINSRWQLLPVIVGQAEVETVEELVVSGLESTDTLVVVSSDLSHYHSYAVAQRIDGVTTALIEQLQPDVHPEQACGAVAVNGLLRAAARCGLGAHCIDMRNSGDTAGSREQVVGYGAYVFV